MAGKNGRKTNNPSAKKRKFPKRKRQSPTSTGFGGLLAHGVRTLLSVLPGSALTVGIADFVFKSLGYSTKSPILNSDQTVTATFQATGLTALFHIALKDILFQSFTHGVRLNAAEWATNYSAGRLRSLCVKIIPQTPQAEKRGLLAMAFIPFRTDEEAIWYNDKSRIQGMLFEQVKMIPGAKSGPASRPLTINYRPKPSDGRLNYDLGMLDEIGAITIGFDQTNRTVYNAFSQDDFSCTVVISGTVLLQRPQEVPYQLKYGRKIDDKMASTQAIILSSDRMLQYDILNGVPSFSEEQTPDGITVRGPVSEAHQKKIVNYLSGHIEEHTDRMTL